MEAYPGDPYAYMPAGGGRKKFRNMEGILPLVLLIVIAFFVLQFLKVLPCVIPIGCGGTADVIVVGIPTTDLGNTLSGEEAIGQGIYYKQNIEPGGIINAKILKNFEVVILQGDPYCNMNTRTAINEYVQGGGKLIVVGDACSQHPEYQNVAGWSWPSGQGIPVPAEMIGEWFDYADTAYGSEMITMNMDHPISKGIRLKPVLNMPSKVFKVIPNGDIITAIKTTEGTSPAIIEGGNGFGKVMYFAYDPGQTPEILLTAVTYMGGI